MYARRYDAHQEEQIARRLPENYAGNAFGTEADEAKPKENEAPCAPVCACDGQEKCCDKKPLFPFLGSKMISADALLLLLAFLLMGEGESEDIPGILIFLMLL